MKKRDVAALYEVRIAELKRHSEHTERQKQKFVTDVYHLRNHPQVHPLKRQVLLNKYLRGRSYDDWIDYYDGHLIAQKNEINEHEAALHTYTKPEPKPFVSAMVVLIAISLIAIGIFGIGHGSGLTSFTTADTLPHEPASEKATVIEIPRLATTNLTNSSGVYSGP